VADVRGARTLMLVSCRVDGRLREEVACGRRPHPEFLRLERDHGVDLLDWSRLPGSADRRSLRQSIAHTRAALERVEDVDAVFSDGEHVGIPLALAMRVLRRRVPHLMLGHHLTTRAKPQLMRLVGRGETTRVLLHSQRQRVFAEHALRIPSSRLAVVPYFADEGFWRPEAVAQEPLIVSAGREHRDYRTLALACAGLSERVAIAAGSPHSPGARWAEPEQLPANVSTCLLRHRELRDLYARARVVVVPLLPNDFQGGVTTVLEGMAMGKAMVVSATEGQRDIVRDGVTGVLVQPGDAAELRHAIRRLLSDPRERARLGTNARSAVETQFSLDLYVARLAAHLDDIRHAPPAAA
jgi:glycosyltransferase involved in cell wall biosynthesis